jgi:hypothetical protein
VELWKNTPAIARQRIQKELYFILGRCEQLARLKIQATT